MAELETLWSKLGKGPAFLLLGQRYLRLDSGTDPWLTQVESKFKGSPSNSEAYDSLLNIDVSGDPEAALAWMSETCTRISTPSWLDVVAEFPWSGVYSSSVDTIWLNAFRNQWREIARVLDQAYYPRDPRNRLTLHCTHLFGAVDRSEPDERPPLSQFDLLRRRPAAINLIQRIPEYVTPLGTILIEAYDPRVDWLKPDDLYPVLANLQPGAVHFFSCDESIFSNQIICRLVDDGKAVLHLENLAQVLQRAKQSGLLRFGPPVHSTDFNHQLTIESGEVGFPRDLWNLISQSAIPITDDTLEKPQAISQDARYWEFRRFLFESSRVPMWEGYWRGFAFVREIDHRLRKQLKSRLRGRQPDQALLFHGPTGSGKTISLGLAAFDIAKRRIWPVLFIDRKSERPAFGAIDQFCQRVENHGAPATLIIWDGMLEPDSYDELQRYLSSRGRRAVVVGSSYRLQSGAQRLEMPDRFSPDEAEQFKGFLEHMGVAIESRLLDGLLARDPSFLVALYRLLPPTRPGIRRGVVTELDVAENQIRSALQQQVIQRGSSALAVALVEAGLVSQQDIDQVTDSETYNLTPEEIQDLLYLIIVPGRFGLEVPIELLVRAWGRAQYFGIGDILSHFDVVHTREDRSGSLFVGPRASIEAQLITQARLGSPESEVTIAKRLLGSIRASTSRSTGNREVEFAVEFIRAIGPQTSERNRFGPYYRDLASSLHELRKNRGVRHPRIMFQEALLLREWVIFMSPRGGSPPDTQDVLAQARGALNEALEVASDQNAGLGLRAPIATELASAAGVELLNLINDQAPREAIRSAYDVLKKAVHDARVIDPTTYHPVDVLMWSTLPLIGDIYFDEVEEAEAIVDLIHGLETIDPELLDTRSQELFYSRQFDLGQKLDRPEISDSAFEELEARGMTSGYYLRAIKIGGHDFNVTKVDGLRAGECERAWRYLEDNRQRISGDPRCVNLMFDYWWLAKTMSRFLTGERIALRFSSADWQYCLEIARLLESFPGSYRRLKLRFLEAIALFHLRRPIDSLGVFREVESDSNFYVRGARRIIRSYLASSQEGSPQRYNGAVRFVDAAARRGEVHVDELGFRIPFLPPDFGRLDLQPGDSLGEFHIAFNFLGPLADPLSRYSP